MATKSISTRISLVGEQEWKRSIDTCRAALADYKSEIALVNTQYKNNATSLDGLMEKEKAQVKYVQQLADLNSLYKQRQQDLKKAYEEQRKDTERLTGELEFNSKILEILQRDFSDNTDAIEKYKGIVKQLEEDLSASQEAEKNWSRELSNTNTQLNNTERQLTTARTELDTTRTTIEALEDPTKRFGLTVADMSEEVQLATGVLQKFLNDGLKEIYDALADSVQAAIDFESAMTRVQKTTNMSDEDIKSFGEEMKNLSVNIPITTDELSTVAEMAGQLGISSEDLKTFTETMAMMGVSTNLSAEEAATALARVASVTGMTTEDYNRLASSVVAVGNNFATTEESVVLMTQRIAGAASSAGIAESDMVGLATAVTSLGVGIDAGGTALQTLINKIETAVSTGDNLDQWAKVMGMSTDELSNKWRTDAAGALETFIQALGDTDESMIVTLKSLGIGEQRLIRTVSLLANAEANTELLSRAMDTSNEAWETNNALQTEAGRAFETTESKITMFGNSVNNLKIAVGDDLLTVVVKAAESGNAFVQVFTEFVEENPAIVAAISGVVAGMGALAAVTSVKAMSGLPAIAEALTAIKTAATAVMGPWAILLTAVAALGAAAIVAYNNMESYNKSAKEWAEKSRDVIKATDEAVESIEAENDAILAQVDAMELLLQKEEKSEGEKAVLARMVEDLNKTIPDLNAKLNEEGTALVNIATNATISSSQLHAMAEALAEQAIQEEKLNALKQLYVDRAKYTDELTVLREKYRQAQEKVNNADDKNLDNIIELESEQNDLAAAIRTLEEALGDVNTAIDSYSDGLEENKTVTSESLTEIDNQIDALKRAQEVYYSTKSAAKQAMDDVVGSFKKVDEASTMSYKTIMGNLQSQIDWMTNYSSNLESLRNRDIEGIKDFAKNYTDGTQESANALASFAKMSDDEIKKIIEKYNEVPQTVESWSDSMATAKSGMDTSIDGMIDSMDRLQRKAENTRKYLQYFGSGKSDAEVYDLIMSGRHAQGLEYVPYDDYAALLHQGEMVLTRAEARAYRESHSRGQSVTNNRNYGGVTLNVYSHQGQDVDKLAEEIMYRIDDATKRKESTWA